MSSSAFAPAYQRKIAIALAFAGTLPTPIPLAWLHKFYLKQYLWGIAYLVLAPTGLPQVACCLEGVWYLTQSDDGFALRFPNAGLPAARPASPSAPLADQTSSEKPTSVHVASQVAVALRELEQLRQEGLVTEYEFEQKRRKLLEQV